MGHQQLHLIHLVSSIDSHIQEGDGDDLDEVHHTTNFVDQVCNCHCWHVCNAHSFEKFEQLLLETDITVGVARRILEKRFDLRNRAFSESKKVTEKRCLDAVRIELNVLLLQVLMSGLHCDVSVSG